LTYSVGGVRLLVRFGADMDLIWIMDIMIWRSCWISQCFRRFYTFYKGGNYIYLANILHKMLELLLETFINLNIWLANHYRKSAVSRVPDAHDKGSKALGKGTCGVLSTTKGTCHTFSGDWRSTSDGDS
jgi:hypothetical protein